MTFHGDATKALLASRQWMLQDGPAVCAQCGVLLAEKALLFRWCDHVFCLTCARGVLESCPACHASAETVDDYGEPVDDPEPMVDLSAWRWILGLFGLAALLYVLSPK